MAAGLRESNRVGQDVERDLTNTAQVRDDFRQLGGEARTDNNPLAVGLRLHDGDGLGQRVIQRNRLIRHLLFAGFYLGDIEQIIDQIEDVVARSERTPMPRSERIAFLRRHGLGLALILVTYLLVTVVRSLSAGTFSADIFKTMNAAPNIAVFQDGNELIAFNNFKSGHHGNALVVDPGLVYTPGPVNLGLRVATRLTDLANVGLVPIINKGFKIDDKVSGAIVTEVAADGAAADKQIEAGDVIMEAGGKPVTAASDVSDAMTGALDGLLVVALEQAVADIRLRWFNPAP